MTGSVEPGRVAAAQAVLVAAAQGDHRGLETLLEDMDVEDLRVVAQCLAVAAAELVREVSPGRTAAFVEVMRAQIAANRIEGADQG